MASSGQPPKYTLPQYGLGLSPEDEARAYLERLAKASHQMYNKAPPARLMPGGPGLRIKFTGVGMKWKHDVYIDIVWERRSDALFVVTRPPYPIYTLAAVAALSALAYPAYVARSGHQVNAILVGDPDRALSVLGEALARQRLVEPGDLTAEVGAGFLGELYSLPVGFVAFNADAELPFKKVDYIMRHEEEEHVGEADVIRLDELVNEAIAIGLLGGTHAK